MKRGILLLVFLVSVLVISSCVKEVQKSPDVPFVVTEVELTTYNCNNHGDTDYCDYGDDYNIDVQYESSGGHSGEYLRFYFTLANDDGCEIWSHYGQMIDWFPSGEDGFRDQVAFHQCAFGERIFISGAHLETGNGEIVQVLTPNQLNGEFILGTPGWRCGNAVCDWEEGSFGETCLNCPMDCGDCGGNHCDDGYCDSDEDCETCPQDCGECPLDTYCGDDIITALEECDGNNLNGKTCNDFSGYTGTGLECYPPDHVQECTFDIGGCDIIVGEEICNNLIDDDDDTLIDCDDIVDCASDPFCIVLGCIEDTDCDIDEGYICNANNECVLDEVPLTECIQDSDCEEGYLCVAEICEEDAPPDGESPGPLQECILTNAYWEDDENYDEFVEGDIVTLTSFGNLACQGKTLSFEVLEDDGILEDDPVINNPSSVNFVIEDSGEVEWSEISVGLEINLINVWGSSANDVYIVSTGEDGNILHYDGTSWEYVGLNVNLPAIRGIWGSSANNVYVVGRAFIEDTNPDPKIWNGVFRQEGIYHYDGTSWKEEDMLDFRYPLDEVWGSSANDVYVTATQDKTVFHYDGNSWELLEMGATNHRFKAIWGSSANDVYLGGLHSTNPAGGNPTSSIFHYDGNSWEEVVRNNRWNYFKDMWGSSADNVYAVGPGNAGKVLHYDGISWEEEIVDPNMPGNKYFIGIWGSSANDVYVVGKPGSNSELHSNIYHFDGVSWERINTGTDYNLIDIWGSSSEDIYTIGWDGKVLHYGITPYTIAEGSWLTETQRDMFGSPEYYFMANLLSSSIQSVDLLREE